MDIDAIEQELNIYVKTLVKDVNIQDLDDWHLLILVVCRSTNNIGVFKVVKRYPSDKEFEISISIPIPNNDQVMYGLAKVKDSYYLALKESNFHVLNSNFDSYSSLYQYIVESSKRAIQLAFMQGFTCNGKKIILNK